MNASHLVIRLVFATVDVLTDDEVQKLLPILSSRARAAHGSVEGFRPPQTGIVEEVASDWHHFVVGRRGVGKSMLLLAVAQHADERGQPVAFIDIETLRDNSFPDVLIRLLIHLTRALEENPALRGGSPWHVTRRRRSRHARRSLHSLRTRLTELLRDPQEAVHKLSETAARDKGRSARLGGKASIPLSSAANAEGEVGLDRSTTAHRSSEREAQFTRTKLEGLRAEAVEFREVLQSAVDAAGGPGAIVILDDFYFIRRQNQPDVLSYLQQVFKNLNIWLKVGSVEHRLNEFEDGDPPRGLQLNQDAGKVQIDTTLANFSHTKTFLEGILRDVCRASGVKMSALVTDTARTRLVVASGGVPRDYLNLVRTALAQATRREGEVSRPKNKITAEDVTTAAPEFLKQKEDDLRVDSQPDDVERLRGRLADVLNFCLNIRHVNVFLVESRSIWESQWGRDISALADLRFFHRIGNPTVKSSEPTYVGKRYQAFAIDLSSYASTRVTTREVDFWTTDGYQRLRAASHVYSPESARQLDQSRKPDTRSHKRAGVSRSGMTENESGQADDQMQGQTTLFEAIESIERIKSGESSTEIYPEIGPGERW